MLRERRDFIQRWSLRRRQPQHARHLRDQDVHGNAGEKADSYRRRKQVGDPAQPEHAAQHENDADHQRQRDGERLVVGRSGCRHQHQPAGEDRRDGGIRAAGQEAVAAQRGKPQRSRARDEREEADLRREAAEPRGGHLFGDRDGGQGQPRDQVARQVARAKGRQRAEDRPVGFLRSVLGHRPCSLRSSKSGNIPISHGEKPALCGTSSHACCACEQDYPACGSVMALRIAASGAASSNSMLSPCDFSPRSRHNAARSGLTGLGPISL